MNRIEIEVINYEKDRLNFFTERMHKANKKYKRLFKKFKDAPYLSEEAEMVSDAGREAHFYGDVVELLEKQSKGEWKDQYQGMYANQLYKCSVCGETAFHDDKRWFLTKYCPNCGAKMKGGV